MLNDVIKELRTIEFACLKTLTNATPHAHPHQKKKWQRQKKIGGSWQFILPPAFFDLHIVTEPVSKM
jgi:hypothetical protein